MDRPIKSGDDRCVPLRRQSRVDGLQKLGPLERLVDDHVGAEGRGERCGIGQGRVGRAPRDHDL